MLMNVKMYMISLSTKLSNVINITAQCDVIVFLDIVTFVLTIAMFKNGGCENRKIT